MPNCVLFSIDETEYIFLLIDYILIFLIIHEFSEIMLTLTSPNSLFVLCLKTSQPSRKFQKNA